jgi:hypothetical protein
MTRFARERRTLALMVAHACRRQHGGEGPCAACQALLAYAGERLDRCPHRVKPSCARCRIHCYRPERRTEVRSAMRAARWWMAWRHPWLSLGHLRDGLRRQR